mmetsp:Transcript_33981/g.89380  ORF Transcript_33981/g.89380 Transcript_33981/m.89380 type:complete len:177 (-) Transcript_33981:323-853(-)
MFGQQIVARGVTDVWRSANDHQYIAIGASKEACARAGMPRGRESNCQSQSDAMMQRMRLCMEDLYERHWGDQLPEVVSMYTNAQAGVSRDRIRARSPAFYRGILAEFSGSPSKECHRVPGKPVMNAAKHEQAVLQSRPFRGTCALLEYLWPQIFGEAPMLDVTHTMSSKYMGGAVG